MRKSVKKTTTAESQARAKAKTDRRKKRRERMLEQVAHRTKTLTKAIEGLNKQNSELKKTLEESYTKIADLTKENANLRKQVGAEEEVAETKEEVKEEAQA